MKNKIIEFNFNKMRKEFNLNKKRTEPRYSQRRHNHLFKSKNLFYNDQEEEVRTQLMKMARHHTDFHWRVHQEYQSIWIDKSVRSIYQLINKKMDLNTHFFQLESKQQVLLLTFERKSKEFIADLQKRLLPDNEGKWSENDLMRTRMLIGTLKTFQNNKKYIQTNTENWMDRLVMKEKVPAEITRHILSFAQTSQ